MRAHGFTAEQLAELVCDGFVTKTRERVVGTEEPFDIARFKLAGQHALGRLAMTGFILKRALPPRAKIPLRFYSRAPCDARGMLPRTG